MRQITQRHSSRGFTLVELLVVITIIGILAAMVFPAMTSAMRRTARMTCGQNLKQVQIALEAYFNDNENTYPYTGTTGDNANKHFGLLFPRWCTSEAIFICRGAQARGYKADNKIDQNPTGMTRTEALKAGENCYAYAFGLGAPNTADSPLACDQLASTGVNSQKWATAGLGSNHGTEGANVVYRDGHVDFKQATSDGMWNTKRYPAMKAVDKGKVVEPTNAAPVAGE
jgi:prepilin-type N-terminal cleavage/methylation domain-containing protein